MNQFNPDGSATVHGRHWGGRARDWAEIQEGQHLSEYESIFERVGLAADAQYCDVGCASGVAALIAWRRGATVCGLDAADKTEATALERRRSA